MLERLGHYRIRRMIGQGAMGVVYEAWDERLERPVAVKTIGDAGENNSARRLWREARALARMNHPGGVPDLRRLREGRRLDRLSGRSQPKEWTVLVQSNPGLRTDSLQAGACQNFNTLILCGAGASPANCRKQIK